MKTTFCFTHKIRAMVEISAYQKGWVSAANFLLFQARESRVSQVFCTRLSLLSAIPKNVEPSPLSRSLTCTLSQALAARRAVYAIDVVAGRKVSVVGKQHAVGLLVNSPKKDREDTKR